jgi:hypothetical protein
MRICWFGQFPAARLDDAARAGLAALLAATPGVGEVLVHTAGRTSDPYLDDGAPPSLALQLYFDDIAAMEAALAKGGHLQALSTLPAAGATQQAMLARAFAVPDPRFRTPAGEPHCTYLVAYEGPAEDLNAWHAHYLASHPPIMARFPAIRQIEICTRLDWVGFLPVLAAEQMQRNKVVFDDAEALTAALNSPVRHEMRADFKDFPKFAGRVTHFPMLTRRVR